MNLENITKSSIRNLLQTDWEDLELTVVNDKEFVYVKVYPSEDNIPDETKYYTLSFIHGDDYTLHRVHYYQLLPIDRKESANYPSQWVLLSELGLSLNKNQFVRKKERLEWMLTDPPKLSANELDKLPYNRFGKIGVKEYRGEMWDLIINIQKDDAHDWWFAGFLLGKTHAIALYDGYQLMATDSEFDRFWIEEEDGDVNLYGYKKYDSINNWRWVREVRYNSGEYSFEEEEEYQEPKGKMLLVRKVTDLFDIL